MSLNSHPNCLGGAVGGSLSGPNSFTGPNQFATLGVGALPTTPAFLQQWSKPSAGPGTVSVTASSGTVTGSGTGFKNSFQNGGTITANGETHTITAISSDTSMTTDNWTSSATNVSYTFPDAGLRMSIDMNGELQIGASPISSANIHTGIFSSNTFTGLALTGYRSFDTSDSVNITTSAFSGAFDSFFAFPSIGASNTQNWTATASGGGLVGAYIQPSMKSGATGTISLMGAIYAQAQIGNSGTCTTLYGIQIDNSATSGGTLTSAYGLGINNQTAATNNTNLLLGTLTPPSGNFDIYSVSTYPSQIGGSFKTGDPSSGAAAWKLGTVRSGTALVQDTTRGVQVSIGGTVVTLAVLTTNP